MDDESEALRVNAAVGYGTTILDDEHVRSYAMHDFGMGFPPDEDR